MHKQSNSKVKHNVKSKSTTNLISTKSIHSSSPISSSAHPTRTRSLRMNTTNIIKRHNATSQLQQHAIMTTNAPHSANTSCTFDTTDNLHNISSSITQPISSTRSNSKLNMKLTKKGLQTNLKRTLHTNIHTNLIQTRPKSSQFKLKSTFSSTTIPTSSINSSPLTTNLITPHTSPSSSFSTQSQQPSSTTSSTTSSTSSTSTQSTTQQQAQPQPSQDQTVTEDGRKLLRSRTQLVEVINGRSKRWLYDPRNKKKLHPQWMWHDDEETFDKMLKEGKGSLRSTYHDIINTTKSFAYSVLLPSGFPDSVHSCYSAFSTWQFVETSFNQFIHVLCSQAMLSCVGLPTDTASTAGGAVAIKWIAKDGIAHFSKLFFTKKYAYQLDFRPKTWGLVSELLFIFGSAFELSTAILAKYQLSEWFLPMAALGASLQSVAHLAWEATHATFNKYLSLRNNLADVTAKADSQMVMSELLGMTLGLLYINYLNEPWHLWAAFLCVLPLHLGSTFGRLKAIKFGKLSSSRLLQHYNSYIQHRLGPTKLMPNVQPQDVLGAVAEHIPPEIYTDKKKALAYIKEKMKKSEQYHIDLELAQKTAQTPSQPQPQPQPIMPLPSSLTAQTSTVQPIPIQSLQTPLQSQLQSLRKSAVDTVNEIQAIQSIMNFATPEQFHYTDRKLGEWFDTKAWVEVYGYAEIKMCAPIDEAFESEEDLFGAVSLFKDKHYLVNYRPSTNKIYLSFEEECEHDDLLQSLLVASRLAYDLRKYGPPTSPALAPNAPQPIEGSPDDIAQRWAPYTMIREALQWTLRYEDQITALLADSGWDVDELTWPDTGTRVYWEVNEYNNNNTKTSDNDMGGIVVDPGTAGTSKAAV